MGHLFVVRNKWVIYWELSDRRVIYLEIRNNRVIYLDVSDSGVIFLEVRYSTIGSSVAEPEAEPLEPKLFGDLEPEPEPKINLNKHFLLSVWRMLGRRKTNFYLY